MSGENGQGHIVDPTSNRSISYRVNQTVYSWNMAFSNLALKIQVHFMGGVKGQGHIQTLWNLLVLGHSVTKKEQDK